MPSNFKSLLDRYSQTWTRKENEFEKRIARAVTRLCIPAFAALFFIVPVIFVVVLPAIYLDEVNTTMAHIHLGLVTYFGLDVFLLVLVGIFMTFHGCIVFSTIIHLGILCGALFAHGTVQYYVLVYKLT